MTLETVLTTHPTDKALLGHSRQKTRRFINTRQKPLLDGEFQLNDRSEQRAAMLSRRGAPTCRPTAAPARAGAWHSSQRLTPLQQGWVRTRRRRSRARASQHRPLAPLRNAWRGRGTLPRPPARHHSWLARGNERACPPSLCVPSPASARGTQTAGAVRSSSAALGGKRRACPAAAGDGARRGGAAAGHCSPGIGAD